MELLPLLFEPCPQLLLVEIFAHRQRRKFLKVATGSVVGTGLGLQLPRDLQSVAHEIDLRDHEIPKRQLGQTGEMVTIIGLGGAHISMGAASKDKSVAL